MISATTSTAGLTVRCELDQTQCSAGIKIADAVMCALNITTDKFHQWNYTLDPKSPMPK